MGSKSKSTQYRKRDPEDQRLTDLRNNLLDKIMPGLESYDPTGWQKATGIADKALEQQMGMMERLPGMFDKQQTMLDQIPGLMERAPALLDQMSGLAGQIPGMAARLPGSLDKSDSILDEMMGVVRSGNVPSAFTDRMNESVTKDLQSGMGNMLNNLASRGVVNSSITSQGTSRLAQQAAEAYNKNYLNAFNSVINGYAQGLQGAQGNTASIASGINALGNGIGALGTGVNALGNAANVYTGAANAYNGAANALTSGMNAVGSIPSQAYEGATAALMPAYNMWKTWQTLNDQTEDYDTVVKQGK